MTISRQHPSDASISAPGRSSERTTAPWWRGAVIYQVYLRSFFDQNGDGIGDLPGVLAKLGYIASLGVDAVWVTPFYRSPMHDFGYDVADYRAVDGLFGDLGDVDRLIQGVHDHGLKIIFDFVLSHTSSDHEWFLTSRESRSNAKADWYVWADAKADGSPPNNWQSIFGGPSWQWEPRRGQYYLHNFLRSQPNLNWHNPAVAAAMMAEAEFWLLRGVDGLRLDAVATLGQDAELRDNPPNPPEKAFATTGPMRSPFMLQSHRYDHDCPPQMQRMAELRQLADRFGDRLLLGELGGVPDIYEVAGRYTRGEEALHSVYTFEFAKRTTTAGDFRTILRDFAEHISDGNGEDQGDGDGDGNSGAGKNSAATTSAGGWLTHSFGNHDSERLLSRFAAMPHFACQSVRDEVALAKLLMALLLSMRGSACIYQGEELGLEQADIPYESLRDPWGIEFYPRYLGRDGCRTPMPWTDEAPHGGFSSSQPHSSPSWLPMPESHLSKSVVRQEADPHSLLNGYRRFLSWRREQPALRDGAQVILDTADPLLAFERESGGQKVICIFNMSNQRQSCSFTALNSAAETGTGGKPSMLDGHGFSAELRDGAVILPAYGVAYLTHASELVK